jgi:hypothetical protein
VFLGLSEAVERISPFIWVTSVITHSILGPEDINKKTNTSGNVEDSSMNNKPPLVDC